MKEPDATLTARKTRHGSMVTWGWSDGRMTISPTEHEEMKRLIDEAEDRYDIESLPKSTLVGHVKMNDDETVKEVEWK